MHKITYIDEKGDHKTIQVDLGHQIVLELLTKCEYKIHKLERKVWADDTQVYIRDGRYETLRESLARRNQNHKNKA